MEGYTYHLFESKRNLDLADRCIMAYTDVSVTERFFEDGTAANSNQEAGNQSIGFLKKAINSIKAMIEKLIDKVTTFFQTAFMGKDERDAFKKFKEAIKTNPEFANKKVTVRDFREINKRYQEALKTIDDGIIAVQKSKSEKAGQIADEVCKKAQNIAKGMGDSAKAVFSVNTALRLAEGNRSIAKWINSQLKEEGYAMKYIESQLGNERAQDFKKKINSSSKLLSLHRMKVMILGQYHSSMSGSLNQCITDFENLLNPNIDVKSNIKRATETRIVDDALGSLNKKAGTDIKKRDVAKAALTVKHEIDSAKDEMQKAAKKRKKNIEKMRRDAERDKERAERDKPRREKEHRKLMNFIGS